MLGGALGWVERPLGPPGLPQSSRIRAPAAVEAGWDIDKQTMMRQLVTVTQSAAAPRTIEPKGFYLQTGSPVTTSWSIERYQAQPCAGGRPRKPLGRCPFLCYNPTAAVFTVRRKGDREMRRKIPLLAAVAALAAASWAVLPAADLAEKDGRPLPRLTVQRFGRRPALPPRCNPSLHVRPFLPPGLPRKSGRTVPAGRREPGRGK